MVETAAYLVDRVISRVAVRQWVRPFPIPLRILFAAHPGLLAPLLRIVHRVIARFLVKQAGLKGDAADTGAVTLIQRFGSAANLNIHLHCPCLMECIATPRANLSSMRRVFPPAITILLDEALRAGSRTTPTQ